VAALVTLTMAVAAAEAVEAVTGIGPRLKWPNDLVWPGDGSGPDRKLAGILAEADWPLGVTASGGWRDPPPTERVTVVVGIGLNVRWGTVPEELAERAVALDHLVPADQVPDRPALLAALLVRLEARYAELVAGEAGPAAVLARWRARTCTLGRRVRVDLGVGDVEGTAVDVDAEGRLVVDGLDGVRRILAAGDVVHLR
jgi:BirA family biotin operon repressor/biotin-[acetyl-CoA-carboxylase] ligase